MDNSELSKRLKDALQAHPDFSPDAVDAFIASQEPQQTQQPTPEQQKCYAACQTARDEAIAKAVSSGNPISIALGIAAAIAGFNACRKACDAS
jgi:hypothetical protein